MYIFAEISQSPFELFCPLLLGNYFQEAPSMKLTADMQFEDNTERLVNSVTICLFFEKQKQNR